MTKLMRALGLIISIVAVSLAVGGYWVFETGRDMLERPLPVAEASTVQVPRGSSFAALAATLAQRGWIEHPLVLRLYARYTGIAKRMQAGEYQIRAGDDLYALLGKLRSGAVKRYSFTIVEGWRFQELMDAVAANSVLRQTLEARSGEAVMAALGQPDEHPEGRFLPETYRFTRGTTDIELLQRAFEAMQQALGTVWAERHERLPIDSAYQALTLASIVEKEAAVAKERRRIAGVFMRRLDKGMRLQADPTVIYGMGERYQGAIGTQDLRTDNPYNTYTRGGLPPTPIAMPGKAALEATVKPASGDALYFVAKGDGTHHFSATLAEHNKAVQRYVLDGS